MAAISSELRARRRRVARIRRRVIGGASGLFVAATAAIVVQLVTGHDPALARSAAGSGSASAGRSSAASGYPTTPGGGGWAEPGDGSWWGSSSGAPSGQVAPLTTSQS